MSRGGAKRSRGVRPLTKEDIARAVVLRRLRAQWQLSQDALAGLLDCSQAAISEWEAAKKPIPEDVAGRLDALIRQGGPEARPVVAVPLEEPGEPLRANAADDWQAPPGEIPSMPQPAPSAMGSGEMPGEAELKRLVAQQLNDEQRMAAANVRVLFSLAGDGLAKVGLPRTGQVFIDDSEFLILTAVQAAEVNAWIARAVALLQPGPEALCLVALLQFSFAVGTTVRDELADKRRERLEAQARQRAPAAAAA